MKAYSLDLRQRILAASKSGLTEEQVAEKFAVSLASVQRFKRLDREQGSLLPKPLLGKRPLITEQQRQEFLDLARSRSDWTLDKLGDAWKEKHGFKPSVSVLSDTCQRFKITLKKSHESPESVTK